MARTSLGPWKFVRDMGSSSHWGLIMAQGQEANGDKLEIFFSIFYTIIVMSINSFRVQESPFYSLRRESFKNKWIARRISMTSVEYTKWHQLMNDVWRKIEKELLNKFHWMISKYRGFKVVRITVVGHYGNTFSRQVELHVNITDIFKTKKKERKKHSLVPT